MTTPHWNKAELLSILALMSSVLNACIEDRETPPICLDGTAYCSNHVEYVCSNTDFIKIKDCPFGCDQDHCKTAPDCINSDTKCENNAAYVCTDYQWQKITDCTDGCNGNVCKTTPSLICTNNDSKCENNAFFICSDNQWQKVTDCPFGCSDNQCKTSPDCENNDTKCENSVLSICRDNQWERVLDCDYGCNGKYCKASSTPAPVCSDGALMCQNNVAYICGAGQWQKTADCPDGCDGNQCKTGNTPAPACTNGAQKCENNVAYTCTDSAWQKTADCPDGCDGNQCKAGNTPAPACTDGAQKCENNVAYTCTAGQWQKTTECQYGCANDQCRPKQTSTPAPTVCYGLTKPVCLDDHTAWLCSDYWSYDPEAPDLFIHHCAPNHICVNGQCVVENSTKCGSDYCKDVNTLVQCTDGNSVEVPCGSGFICSNRRCIADASIRSCKQNSDCKTDELCHDGLCYLAGNMALKEGDPCTASGPNAFQEYCKDGKEYYCYDTVEVQDCNDGYNGCTLIIQDAYQGYGSTAAPRGTRNAACRGTDEQLSSCGQAGITHTRCYNNDEFFSIHYSMSSTCVYGTDGRPVFLEDAEQTQCTDFCNDATGYCTSL